jgi:hypothetical protein
MRYPNVRRLIAISGAIPTVVLAGELWLSVKDDSQTFDEAAHIYSGYSYWTRVDFGMNPEHPPLVKLVAALKIFASAKQTTVVGGRGNFSHMYVCNIMIIKYLPKNEAKRT